MAELLLEQHLAQAEAHIVFSEQLIADQRKTVARLEASGLATTQSHQVLAQLEELRLEHVSHRDWLLKKLAENPCESAG
jgi:hypothetical protein